MSEHNARQLLRALAEIDELRDVLKDLREAAAHVLANEPSDGIVGGPWLRSEYEDSEAFVQTRQSE